MQIRPIKPTDTEHYRSILERTSLEDRYCRFFHAVDHFDPAEISRFVELPPDAVGFIAEENGRALGVVHAFMVERDTAELAIIVAADARRRGVGFALTSRVITALRARDAAGSSPTRCPRTPRSPTWRARRASRPTARWSTP